FAITPPKDNFTSVRTLATSLAPPTTSRTDGMDNDMSGRDTGHPRSARRQQWPAAALMAGAVLAAVLTARPATAATGPAHAHVAAEGGNAVIAWGRNGNGQIGNGTIADSSKPVFALPGTQSRYATVRTGA